MLASPNEGMELPPTRPHCYRCDKVQALCLCNRIETAWHRTRISVVQHPREARHPFGTVRIARLGLRHCDVQVAHREHVDLSHQQGVRSALLFPGPGARELESMTPEEHPDHLVVVDGTWSQAQRLLRVSPALQGLPQVSFRPGAPSNYRIRKEPTESALSTVEAIVRALTLLEPDNHDVHRLLEAFDGMIEDQLALRKKAPASKRVRLRKRPRQRLPGALRGPIDQLAFLHAEQHRPRGHQQSHPLRVSFAFKATTGDTLVRGGPSPNPARVDNMGLGPVDVSRGASLEDVGTMLREQLDAKVVVIAWPHSVGTLLQRLNVPNPFISLKHVLANLGQELVPRNEACTTAPPVPGRAGLELQQLQATVRRLRSTSLHEAVCGSKA